MSRFGLGGRCARRWRMCPASDELPLWAAAALGAALRTRWGSARAASRRDLGLCSEQRQQRRLGGLLCLPWQMPCVLEAPEASLHPRGEAAPTARPAAAFIWIRAAAAQVLRLWPGREACSAWPCSTPGKVVLAERGELGLLQHQLKPYSRGEVQQLEWLDTLLLRVRSAAQGHGPSCSCPESWPSCAHVTRRPGWGAQAPRARPLCRR
jgi:hypothetical protein